MENLKELDIEQIKSISGGTLNTVEISILNSFIESSKEKGLTMEWLLTQTSNIEAQEYIKKHW